MRRTRGFTLIELLIAMAIVSLIGVIALTGISVVIDNQEIATQRTERWREIQLAMRIIVQDMAQTHPRPVRDELGAGYLPCFYADPNYQYALEFSRGGWSNPAGFARGNVLRVAYDIEEDTLVRFHWPVADRTIATPPVRTELLTGITLMEVVFIDDNGNESIDWPGVDNPDLLERPRAVRFMIELEDLGEIWRLIEIRS